ncbi:MAG: DUF2197 domain-containing protein [Clostridia bacterium]|nr:MAG: DUF2197 domain-containing protein [Clostridia bacterium]
MQVRCSLCGAEVELTKIHKDYDRLARDPQGVFVCPKCHRMVQVQAQKQQNPPRPI